MSVEKNIDIDIFQVRGTDYHRLIETVESLKSKRVGGPVIGIEKIAKFDFNPAIYKVFDPLSERDGFVRIVDDRFMDENFGGPVQLWVSGNFK